MKPNECSLRKQFIDSYRKVFNANLKQLKLYKIFETREYEKVVTNDFNYCYSKFCYFKFKDEEVAFENEKNIVDLKNKKIFIEAGFFYYIETVVIEKHFYYRTPHGYSSADTIDFYWKSKELK